MTARQTSSQPMRDGVFPGTSIAMVLPYVQTNTLAGLIEEDDGTPFNGKASMADLADSLNLEIDDLFPMAETLQLLRFAELRGAELVLTLRHPLIFELTSCGKDDSAFSVSSGEQGSMSGKAKMSSEAVHSFVEQLFGEDLHAKRVTSLAKATVGTLQASSLAVSAIGHGLALAQGGLSRHAIKQVDRMLSNDGIDVDALMADWTGYCVGSRTEIVVAMDWTDFDADGHSTLMLSLLTEHGRATPLLWLTVRKAELKERRNHYEYWIVTRLAELMPTDVKVLLLADRGFGDTKLYRVLKDELNFDYVIRFRGNIKVTAAGESRPAKAWIGPSGRARLLREATVTTQGCPVGAVVCVHARDMKEPWCLATSLTTVTAKTLIELYARRWGIECSFRDAKDWRFGMGMAATRVSSPARRDRLWLIAALAIVLLTLLGAAGEAIGYDRHLRTSTTSRRVHSLFRQGVMYYQLIPNMPEQRLRPLILQFETLIRRHRILKRTFGII